ncbi:unnamed protein product, partial [Mesorhabditis spiculigera]
MDYDTKFAKIVKYMKHLKNEDTRRRALEKLAKVDMDITLLVETKVGKAVNKLQNDDQVGPLASKIVKRWKNVARKEGYEEEARNTSSSGSSSPETPPPTKKAKVEPLEEKPGPSFSQEKKPKKEEPVRATVTLSNAFEQVLAAADRPDIKAKQHKPRPLPELDILYKPLPAIKPKKAVQVLSAEEEQLKHGVLKYKSTDRHRVFAGTRKTVTTKVEPLFKLCLNFIGNNIDNLEDTGDIPFDILQPVLERCTPTQLHYIESRNPSLEEDGDCLWEKHMKRRFPNEEPEDYETWKHAYFRIEREKTQSSEKKLAMLKQKIGASAAAAACHGRQTMLADVHAPANIRKRQRTNNMPFTAKPVPDAVQLMKARRQLHETGDSSALRSMPSAVVNINSNLGAHRGKKVEPKKKGALMLKTLKMVSLKRR